MITISTLPHETNNLSDCIEPNYLIQQPIPLNYPIIQESTKSYTLLTNYVPPTIVANIPSTSAIINDNNYNILIKNLPCYDKNVKQVLKNSNSLTSTSCNKDLSNLLSKSTIKIVDSTNNKTITTET